MSGIYFDHAATSPMRPEALEAYVAAAGAGPGNPSSLHAFGRAARSRLTRARDEIAGVLGCRPDELVFTGGGTESDNAALFGAARAMRARDGRRLGVVTTAVEHHAVLHACRALASEGFELTVLPVDETGRVSLEDARAAIGPTTAVVSVMAGNNEVGTLQPYAEIGELARAHGAVMHVDAVQAFGYEPIDLSALPVDLLSVSAHKMGGPQGVGALYVRTGTPWQPLLYGGSQERKRRAGTENVAGIAAFAAAAKLAAAEREARRAHAETVRGALIRALTVELGADAFALNGEQRPESRLPHIASIVFYDVPNETMLMSLDLAGVAASGGSACTSGSLQPSHVLEAMGLASHFCRQAVRFSFGLGNTTAEAEKTAKIIATITTRLRNR
ncbi:cysteine desulfurase family protein [Cohnella sp. REN36]|uniref:cysteine desulfurase family protein n=1 Tax=Cohnella sp. REN36 TaxID=2887347 RepID=UPI001D13887A|nr:cysteine desulfurase family protein [Cohnella sp. REN36]MCC3375609.1 cysteine desulfurase [Cohnella sp. REN36]